jgi:hypothetical protein
MSRPDCSVLDQALETPDRVIESADLLSVWRCADLRFICERPSWLDHAWRLPNRLRGAIGQQLHASASPAARAGAPCSWSPPCAWDVFFRDRRLSGLRQPLAKPWVIGADEGPDPGTVEIRITLLGWATEWIGEMAEAATQALNGNAPGGEANRTLRLPVLDRCMAEPETPANPDTWPEGAPALLVFETPVLFRQRGRAHDTLETLPLRLAERLESLAPWFGVRLRIPAASLQAMQATLARDESSLRPWRGERTSVRQGGRLPVEGRFGPLVIGPPPPVLRPLLMLGQWTHVGSNAALGQGRYALRPLPMTAG